MAIRAPDGAKNGHILPTGQWYAPSAVYSGILLHTLAYSGILWHALAYSGIINASLITADGAYHCPVGSIWPFLSPSGDLGISLV